MCGIAGIVEFGSGEPRCKQISAMLQSLARRGPDDEGRYSWHSATLAHRRLSIIDLSSAGHQPMMSDDGQIGLVFNGCIYNFPALRAELEQSGHVFHSNCDTEVILRGYQQWGMREAVKRFRGMFAFAIWDDRQKKLTLVRDRLGIKPLCYSLRGSRLGFASTPGALKNSGFGGVVQAKAVLDYLEFGFVTEDNCIFEGVRKIPPATIVEFVDGRMDSFVYWSEPEPSSKKTTFEDAIAETESRLLEAVRLRLIADVPVSALLSGGIDSTLVCWALSKLGANVRTYTIGLPGEPEDEAAMASQTANKIGIPHERITLDEIDADLLETEIRAFSEPFASYSALGMLQLSKAIKPFATVMLTGDGGDEAFLGYPVHLNSLAAQGVANRLPGFSPAVWKVVRPGFQRLPFLRRPKHFLDYAMGGLGNLTRVHDGLPYYERHGLLGSRLDEPIIPQRQIPASFTSARRLLSDVLDYNKHTEFVSEFLTKVDGATMYYAIEARSPFLDQGIWELASSLDYSLRLRGRELKSIPRELVRRRVGPEIASRPKRGFQMPVERWITGRWRPRLQALLDGTVLVREKWLQQDSLRQIVESALSTGKGNIHLWRLMLLNMWFEQQSTV